MSQQRNSDLAKIHIAKQQLGMDDDSYHTVLMTIGRVKSAADLDTYGRSAVLEHLKHLGFKSKTRKGHTKAANHPQDKKIRALWLDLAAAGAVKDASEAALLSYVRRMTGCERLEWITNKQAATVIESLKSWRARVTA